MPGALPWGYTQGMELMRPLLLGLLVGMAFHRLGLPGGAVVGAMLGAGLYQALSLAPAPAPAGLDLVAQLLAGVAVGLSFRRELLQGWLLPWAALAALGFLALALALALVYARLLGVSPHTLFFALSPGGITGMGPLSRAEGGDAGLVGLFHMVRVFLLFLLVPLLARLLTPNPR
ncbi:AbrB family transcriptional regulator [Thermus thalpophilus]|uniref:AbrB family transcriptional regulator n=1 Tax=Thermus thalpophilus TaxID=2908147 RepID=UPI002431405A|nr:AbrB family transcriptional regulator [Thermus thalpophilus]